MELARTFLLLSIISLACAGLTFLDISRKFKILSLFLLILFLDAFVVFACTGFSLLLRKQEYQMIEATTMVMLTLYKGEKHGYKIWKETGLNLAKVYRIISLLVYQEFIQEAYRKERKIYYCLTPLGKRELDKRIAMIEKFLQAMRG